MKSERAAEPAAMLTPRRSFSIKSARSNEALQPGPHISVLIPTKDRPHDLLHTLHTITRQTVLPAQLVIVDQSDTPRILRSIERQIHFVNSDSSARLRLAYLHAPSLSNPASARNLAMDYADGDIWLFLDDDVSLEPDFIEEIQRTYSAHADVDGVSGIITNYAAPSRLFRAWLKVFTWGPFYDERQPIYWKADALRASAPLCVRKFGSGLMSFRADVIHRLRFDDTPRSSFRGEDVDFCMQLRPGSKLLVAPKARLTHKGGPAGRSLEGWLRGEVSAAFYLYERHWNSGLRNRFCLGILVTGYTVLSILESLRQRSTRPLRGFYAGVCDRSWRNKNPSTASPGLPQGTDSGGHGPTPRATSLLP